MDQTYREKLEALEDQVTQNGALFRNLQSKYTELQSEITLLKEENNSLKSQLIKITQSKKWRLITKLAKYGDLIKSLRKM